MSKAPASNRAYEKATFSFGMVALPLSVYTGTVSDHGIKRNQFIPVEEDGPADPFPHDVAEAVGS